MPCYRTVNGSCPLLTINSRMRSFTQDWRNSSHIAFECVCSFGNGWMEDVVFEKLRSSMASWSIEVQGNDGDGALPGPAVYVIHKKALDAKSSESRSSSFPHSVVFVGLDVYYNHCEF